MDSHVTHSFFDRRPIPKSSSPAPAVKWFKEWVPQDLVSTGGKCLVLKWVNEATLNAIKEKLKDPHGFEPEPEPEPTTEVLFLCSYEGCGKTFIDAGALRKHSHIHGERQHVCQYENCGKKFLDSSKLKRHYLIHTGERDYVCPHEGCGKAFSLDFNLRSHMKTHSQENYHVCPYPECGKRYAHEYKLKNHVASHHEKPTILDPPKYTPPAERPTKTSKASTGVSGPPSAERPHACPYDGCEKAYIHEYKLNLHLRREHPGHFPEDNHKNNDGENDGDGSDQDGYAATKHSGRNSKAQKSSRAKPSLKLPPSKAPNRRTAATNTNVPKKTWPVREVEAGEEEDSEETEEERDNPGNGWTHVEDDEETEYED